MQSKVYSIQFSFSTIVQICYYDLGVEVKKEPMERQLD